MKLARPLYYTSIHFISLNRSFYDCLFISAKEVVMSSGIIFSKEVVMSSSIIFGIILLFLFLFWKLEKGQNRFAVA